MNAGWSTWASSDSPCKLPLAGQSGHPVLYHAAHRDPKFASAARKQVFRVAEMDRSFHPC